MRLGRRLAIDFGVARIGVAVSSQDGLIAGPLDTIKNDDLALESILRHVTEIQPLEIYIGLPLNLQGDHTKSTTMALDFARSLDEVTEVPVRMIDERLSTRAAQSQLTTSGKNGKKSKALIDAAAASLILESALDFEKSTSRNPGKTIEECYA